MDVAPNRRPQKPNQAQPLDPMPGLGQAGEEAVEDGVVGGQEGPVPVVEVQLATYRGPSCKSHWALVVFLGGLGKKRPSLFSATHDLKSPIGALGCWLGLVAEFIGSLEWLGVVWRCLLGGF